LQQLAPLGSPIISARDLAVEEPLAPPTMRQISDLSFQDLADQPPTRHAYRHRCAPIHAPPPEPRIRQLGDLSMAVYTSRRKQ
jgi:hypothetical protein